MLGADDGLAGFSVWVAAPGGNAALSTLDEDHGSAVIDSRGGDGDRLEQVLVNVLSNAIKFSPEGGTVDVRWRLTDCAAECVVSDNGPGIPAEQLEAIFDKFRQIGSASTRQHGGAGLGLAISRRLVEQFGGKIWAESEPGRGARFVVRLRLDLGR